MKEGVRFCEGGFGSVERVRFCQGRFGSGEEEFGSMKGAWFCERGLVLLKERGSVLWMGREGGGGEVLWRGGRGFSVLSEEGGRVL